MNKKQEISVSIDWLVNTLEAYLTKGSTPNSKLISETIIENLAITETGLSHLLMAFTGCKQGSSYLPGDEVLVPITALSSYDWSKPAMEQEGIIVNGKIKCTIMEIDMLKKSALRVKFMKIPINKAGTPAQPVEDIYNWVSESRVYIEPGCRIVRPDLADKL